MTPAISRLTAVPVQGNETNGLGKMTNNVVRPGKRFFKIGDDGARFILREPF
jgi:hypothetical protein